MAEPLTVSLFLPHAIFNKCLRDSYILGYWYLSTNHILINCTTAIEKKKQNFHLILNRLLNYNVFVHDQENIRLLGFIYSSQFEKPTKTDFINNTLNEVAFIIRINEISRSFHVEYISVRHYPNINDVQVIVYDGCIANSQLLPLSKNFSNVDQGKERTFISFLVGTCQNFLNNSDKLFCDEQMKKLKVFNFIRLDSDKTFQVGTQFLYSVLWLIFIFYRIISYLFKWLPQSLMNVLLLTALGQQFHQRYLHFENLCANYKIAIPLSVKCKNLTCAILIDLACGYLVTYALLNSDIPSVMLNTAILKTNDIVSGLQNLINWLMGVPAGLKLNIPLNNALGKFFLYHIYLWESYMMVVQPLFAFIFKISTVIGVFGLTFFFCLLNDLISLATIHIYCFYGYAARLYGYQVTSLSALWRLFRGKKWNPLRQRIDSYTYNVHQLYLGTLIFTVLLFLLPTVMVYYFVFSCLRILVLVIQGIMSRIINILTICPLYCVISRFLNSSETTGDVYFTVLNSEGALTLSMQASQIPVKTVIQLTLPEMKKYYEVLTWKEFLSSIIYGKIVYPL